MKANRSRPEEGDGPAAAPGTGSAGNRLPRPGFCGDKVPSYTRRSCVRARSDTPVIFSVNGSGVFHRGRMINYSKNGLCFSSFCCLPRGTVLRVKARDPETDCFEPSQAWHEASVIWVRQANTENRCFQTGIRFCESTG